jgi:hypothetical protein
MLTGLATIGIVAYYLVLGATHWWEYYILAAVWLAVAPLAWFRLLHNWRHATARAADMYGVDWRDLSRSDRKERWLQTDALRRGRVLRATDDTSDPYATPLGWSLGSEVDPT